MGEGEEELGEGEEELEEGEEEGEEEEEEEEEECMDVYAPSFPSLWVAHEAPPSS